MTKMTWERWQAMTSVERDSARDNSGLHPALIGLEGKRVTVTPKRAHGRSTFIVGRTTGWKPCHLAMRAGSYSSSDTINPNEQFTVTKARNG